MLVSDDFLQITNLAARSGIAFDEGNMDVWLDSFTVDGVFKLTQSEDTKKWIGRAELSNFVFSAATSINSRGFLRRWLNSPLIDGGMDRATFRAFLLVVTIGARPVVVSTGMHHDRLIKNQGAWKIEERHVILDPPRKADEHLIERLRSHLG